MNEIPTNSLLANYLPADYSDSFSKEVMTKESITPDAFFGSRAKVGGALIKCYLRESIKTKRDERTFTPDLAR